MSSPDNRAYQEQPRCPRCNAPSIVDGRCGRCNAPAQIGPVPPNWAPRCQGFNTEPGVIYHAHDLPRCREMAVGTIDHHILCQHHIDAWIANHA